MLYIQPHHTHHPTGVHAQQLPTCDTSGGDHLLYPQHHLNGDIPVRSTLLHLGINAVDEIIVYQYETQ